MSCASTSAPRELTIYYLSALVGAGILVVPGIALEIAGPASLVAWLVLAIATFPIAAVFARFSAEYPNASGVSYVVRTAFGWRAGTSIGLLLLLINLVGNPILGLAAARYLVALFGWTASSRRLRTRSQHPSTRTRRCLGRRRPAKRRRVAGTRHRLAQAVRP